MACLTRELPLDCIVAHWSKIPGLEKRGSGWRAPCPVCGVFRVIEVSIVGGRIMWNKHCSAEECSEAEVTAALARLVGPCFPSRVTGRPRRKDTVPRSDLEKLIGLPGAALELRVAMLAWDCSPAEAAAKLGMPDRTLRWAVTRFPR